MPYLQTNTAQIEPPLFTRTPEIGTVTARKRKQRVGRPVLGRPCAQLHLEAASDLPKATIPAGAVASAQGIERRSTKACGESSPA